jgi:hypothetical protein
MWLESAVESLRDVPSKVTSELASIGEIDGETRSIATMLQKEESQLLDELKNMIKEGTPFNEADIREKATALVSQREELLKRMNDQTTISENLYLMLDKCILAVDANVTNINTVLTQTNGVNNSNNRSKRGGSGAATNGVTINLGLTEDAVDPNEPIYCTCRKVSYGKMIGCENDSCKIEWFHYACVGLTSNLQQAPDVWYCRDCREELKITWDGKPQAVAVVELDTVTEIINDNGSDNNNGDVEVTGTINMDDGVGESHEQIAEEGDGDEKQDEDIMEIGE